MESSLPIAHSIGVTERGDAGIFIEEWQRTIKKVDGAILITKDVNDNFIDAVLSAEKPIIVHATTTGWGGTYMEPNVPDYVYQLCQVKKLNDKGFPLNRIVVRIDPIIPLDDGIQRSITVLKKAIEMGIVCPKSSSSARVRTSIVDNYPHVRSRFYESGQPVLFGGSMYPNSSVYYKVIDAFAQFKNEGIIIETCAETIRDPMFKAVGCISPTDLLLMGFDENSCNTKSQQRSMCKCLGIKTELLSHRGRCSHGCLYCYWK